MTMIIGQDWETQVIYIFGNFHESKNLINFFFNLGWGYDDILPYFKKSMDQQDPQKLFENPEIYSTEGKSLYISSVYPDIKH